VTDPLREGTEASSVTDIPDPAPASGIGRASAFLASGTLVSRVLGFVSLVVLASAIGVNSAAGDTFALANQLPNNIYALVAGGLLSAVIVPQIVKAGLHDDGGAGFINKVITIGLTAFVVVTIVATACAPLLVRLYGSGFNADELALATALAYWCLPQILFYALYSLIGETLNARGVFGPFTWAPVLNNIVAISGLLVFIALYGGQEQHQDASAWTPAQVALLAGSATLGIVVQAFSLFFFLRRAGLRYRPDFRWRGVGLGGTARAASWVFVMFLVTQVSGVFEARIASTATGDASVNAMKIAWTMFMLPHSIVTVSIVTAYFTRMSGHVRDGRLGSLRDDLSSALRTILLVMVFSAVGLAVLSFSFSSVFGNDFAETSSIAQVYLAYLTGLVPFTIFFVLLRVFYALDRTRAAFVIQVVQTAFYVTGALLVGAFVPREWVAVGLALVLSAAVALQGLLSAAYLRRVLGPLDTWRVLRSVLWFLAAAIVAAGAGIGVVALLGGVGPGTFAVGNKLTGILTMILAGGVMAVVYAAVLWVTRNPELRAFAEPILRRLRTTR